MYSQNIKNHTPNWIDYMRQPYSMEDNNCLDLVIDIYKKELDIDLKLSIGQHLGLDQLISSGWRWRMLISLAEIDDFITNVLGPKIDMSELMVYDVLIFKTKNNRPTHFGLYIGNNQFLHIDYGKAAFLSSLGQEQRENFHAAYRHRELVGKVL